MKLSDRYFTTTIIQDNFKGSDKDDYFDAGDGNDNLYGNGGNDILVGGDGNDYLVGGTNNDSLYGNNGDDALAGVKRFIPQSSDFPCDPRGLNEIDVITGGAGADYFLLGEALSQQDSGFSSIFYDDHNR